MSTYPVTLPTKEERHKLFGSVPPIKGTKPTEKDKMIDLQNTPKNFLFALDAVGISNVKHPVVIQDGETTQATIATFELSTSLVQDRKGINMSRLTEQLDQYHNEGWVVTNESL
ncbi:GTP cyclohydrolase, FolE2/MptA family, partial [Exiguobacterium artemiae]